MKGGVTNKVDRCYKESKHVQDLLFSDLNIKWLIDFPYLVMLSLLNDARN